MSAKGRSAKIGRRSGLSGRPAGFSLVEITIALALAAIVVLGVYGVFNTLHKWWITSSVKAEMRQSARVGIETVTRDLEMAGYQTTSYGDINKTNLAVTYAAAGAIEVDQQRLDIATGAYTPGLVYYHLATDVSTGRKNLYRQIRTEPGLASPDEIVAENVSVFDLAYFDKDGAAFADLPDGSAAKSSLSLHYTSGFAPPANLKAIRRIDITLTTEASRGIPIGAMRPTYTLTASVSPHNLESTETISDTVPPAAPTGLAVIDSGSCVNKLLARWNKNTEPDLAGYILFYDATHTRTIPVTGLANPGAPQITLNPDNLYITKYVDRIASPNIYTIQVAAYDSSGNVSSRSAAVSANPLPDVNAFGGGHDTTANPFKPSAPRNMTVTAPADYTLTVSWEPPGDASATVGYRLYRSLSPFVSGAHIAESMRRAAETTLNKDVTSFTDTGLEGCRIYYYALASVNCDESLVTTYVYNSAGASDYAAASGTTTDRTPPPPPSLAGSMAGFKRAFISLKNPTVAECADFSRTEIWFNTTATPPALVNSAVTGGRLVPDTDCAIAGNFKAIGSQVIIFDSETRAEPNSPTLPNEWAYNFLAVSYDRCGNTSIDSTAIALIRLCGDDPPGPPPEWPINPDYSTCDPATVTLSWLYPPKHYTGANQLYDFAGFRVWRSGPVGGSPAEERTAGPTWAESWTDGGPLLAGGTYTYTVRATDCVYENRKDLYPNNYSLPLTIGPIQPGGLISQQSTADPLAPENFVATLSDEAAPYTYHNNVRFYLRNSSQAKLLIKKMAVTWDNPNVVLQQITVGGGSSQTAARVINAGGVVSGTAVAVSAQVDDRAVAVGSPSGPVPIVLRFATSSGAVNRLTDMRNESLTIDFWIRNLSLQDSECSAAYSLRIDVPPGPILGDFSQDKPGRYGIDSYAVVGPTGTARDTDIKVVGGNRVNVYGAAFDNSGQLFSDGLNRGFQTLKVVATDAPVAEATAVPTMPLTGTFVDRPLQNLAGNRYAIFHPTLMSGETLPQVTDRVVWYYALAVDRTGNWDRVPNPDFGNYAYHQLPFDPCLVTAPNPPVLSLTTDAGHAYLTWTAPTTYTDGSTIPPADPLRYDVYFRHDEASPWQLLPGAVNLTTTSYTHVADLLASTGYYAVRAKNSCSAPRVSDLSNVVAECEGAFGSYCSAFNVAPATANVGDTLMISAPDICMYKNNGTSDAVLFQVSGALETKSFTVAELADTGSFYASLTTTENAVSGANQIRASAGTLTVRFFTVDNVLRCTATVTITGGNCATIPKAPVLGSVTRQNATSNVYTLNWTAPTQNTDNSPLTDLRGYRIYYSTGTTRPAACVPGTNCLDNVTGGSPQTFTLAGAQRYYFWMVASDTCPSPNSSADSNRVLANR